MPAYPFEALDAQGSTRKGVIEADSAKSARGLLRAQALDLRLNTLQFRRLPGLQRLQLLERRLADL